MLIFYDFIIILYTVRVELLRPLSSALSLLDLPWLGLLLDFVANNGSHHR